MQMDELYRKLDAVVEEKTFSLTAVEAIKSLRTEFSRQVDKIIELETKIKTKMELVESLNNKVAKYEAELKIWNERELVIKKREESMINLEKLWACADVKSGVYKDIFDKLFGNTIVRESVQRTVKQHEVIPQPGYTTPYPGQFVPTQEKQTGKTEETVITEREEK